MIWINKNKNKKYQNINRNLMIIVIDFKIRPYGVFFIIAYIVGTSIYV